MRIPARSKPAARTRYVRFLQLSLSCLSASAHCITGPRPYGGSGELALTTEPEKIRLSRSEASPLFLTATQDFHFERDPTYVREWKVKTDGYAYRVFVSEEEAGQVFSWHWHPGIKPGCHIHVGPRQGKQRALYRLHVPSDVSPSRRSCGSSSRRWRSSLLGPTGMPSFPTRRPDSRLSEPGPSPCGRPSYVQGLPRWPEPPARPSWEGRADRRPS